MGFGEISLGTGSGLLRNALAAREPVRSWTRFQPKPSTGMCQNLKLLVIS